MTKTKQISLLMIAAVVLIGIGAVWYFFFSQTAMDRPVEGNFMERAGSEELGITFGVESGPTAFSFVQSGLDQLTNESLLKAYVLMESERQAELFNDFDNTDTPPTLSVLIFQLPENASRDPQTGERILTQELIERWTIQNDGYTNASNKTTDFREERVDGENAIYFESQAVFPQATYVIKSRDKMYLITAQYETLNDRLYTALGSLIESVRFE